MELAPGLRAAAIAGVPEAAEALGATVEGARLAAEQLAGVLERTDDMSVRTAVALGLARAGDVRATGHVAELLHSNQEAGLAEALGRLAQAGTAPSVLVQAGERWIHRRGAGCPETAWLLTPLALMGEPGVSVALPGLRALLQSPEASSAEQRAVAGTVGELGSRAAEAAPELSSLASPGHPVADAAVLALLRITGKSENTRIVTSQRFRLISAAAVLARCRCCSRSWCAAVGSPTGSPVNLMGFSSNQVTSKCTRRERCGATGASRSPASCCASCLRTWKRLTSPLPCWTPSPPWEVLRFRPFPPSMRPSRSLGGETSRPPTRTSAYDGTKRFWTSSSRPGTRWPPVLQPGILRAGDRWNRLVVGPGVGVSTSRVRVMDQLTGPGPAPIAVTLPGPSAKRPGRVGSASSSTRTSRRGAARRCPRRRRRRRPRPMRQRA